MEAMHLQAASVITDKQRKLEISAVFLTGIGKFIFMDQLQWKLPFILIVILFWTAYVVYRNKTIPGILQYWGFRDSCDFVHWR